MFDIILAYACLASGIVANKFLLQTMPFDLFIGIRMFVAGLILLPIALKNSPRLRFAYLKVDGGAILFITLCTTLIPSLTKAFALQNMLASKQTLLGSIDPFVTALYAYFLWNERLSPQKIGGMLLGLCGVIVASIAISPAEQQWGEFLYISYPELATLFSVILSRYGWIRVQTMLKGNRYTPTEMNSITMVLSGFTTLLVSYVRGAQFPAAALVTPWFLMVFIFTIVVGNMLGYNLYSTCLKKYSATWMSLAGFLVPIFVLLLSKLLGREALTLNFFISAALLFAGLCLFYYDELYGKKLKA